MEYEHAPFVKKSPRFGLESLGCILGNIVGS